MKEVLVAISSSVPPSTGQCQFLIYEAETHLALSSKHHLRPPQCSAWAPHTSFLVTRTLQAARCFSSYHSRVMPEWRGHGTGTGRSENVFLKISKDLLIVPFQNFWPNLSQGLLVLAWASLSCWLNLEGEPLYKRSPPFPLCLWLLNA